MLNEEKWTVQAPGGKAQEAQGSIAQAKAVSHLSRMSLAEFNERQNEMKRELAQPSYGDVPPSQAGKNAPADAVSKAGSTVSKPV